MGIIIDVSIIVEAVREFPDGLVIIYRTCSVLGESVHEAFVPFDKESP